MNHLSQNLLIIQLTFWRTNYIIKRHSSVSESEDKDSASVSLINSDIRNDSIETSEHNSVKKSDSKTTSKFLFDSMTYNDKATIQSQQDNTSSVLNTFKNKVIWSIKLCEYSHKLQSKNADISQWLSPFLITHHHVRKGRQLRREFRKWLQRW